MLPLHAVETLDAFSSGTWSGNKRDLERDSGTHSCSMLLLCKSWSLYDYCDFLQGAGCCWVGIWEIIPLIHQLTGCKGNRTCVC